MARTSKSTLDHQAETLSRLTGKYLRIERSNGGSRLVEVADRGGEADISPRLSAGELQRWLNAFYAGFMTCKSMRGR